MNIEFYNGQNHVGTRPYLKSHKNGSAIEIDQTLYVIQSLEKQHRRVKGRLQPIRVIAKVIVASGIKGIAQDNAGCFGSALDTHF